MNNIVLTGFMGTGKTTTGRLLAARLRRAFLDTDELIVQRTGKEISDIFAADGGQQFRRLEREIAAELAPLQNLVIATGGRLMLDPENQAALTPGNLVLSLQADPLEILRRISRDDVRRPLLDVPQPEVRIAQLLEERAAGYDQFPQVPTSDRSAEAIVEEIIAAYHLQPLPARQSAPQRLTVTHPQGSYDLLVGRGLLSQLRDLAPLETCALAIISDDHVGPLFISALPKAACATTFRAGEAYKTLDTASLLYERLLDAGVDRSSAIVALGGGVVGDLAGFVAATYMRGLPLVQCPTTLLAMVDASVGGKTGVDLPQGKNLVGAFKQPLAVIADVDTLRTLPPAEFAAGMAEVIKHAFLAGGELLALLEENDLRQEQLFQDEESRLLEEVVVKAVQVKREVVQNDPYEKGQRALLNLGHTFAHAIERVSDYRVSHGYAVAIGLVCAARLSATAGFCEPSLQQRIERLLERFFLPTRVPAGLDSHELLAAMSSDKKKMHGRLRFVLMRDIGDAFVTPDVPTEAVIQTLEELQAP